MPRRDLASYGLKSYRVSLVFTPALYQLILEDAKRNKRDLSGYVESAVVDKLYKSVTARAAAERALQPHGLVGADGNTYTQQALPE
jgi:hypothetical protein